MGRRAALCAFLLLTASATAAKPKIPKAPKGGGWAAAQGSLLRFDRRGKLVDEVGIGEWDVELEDGVILRQRMRGGTSRDGRFAWHWQKLETVKLGRTDEVLASTTTLSYLGTRGQTLWESSRADAPPEVSILEQSHNGETFLVVERSTTGWDASVYTFTGNRIMGIRAAERLEKVFLTENGRYALVLWSAFRQPLIYSFLRLKNKRRKDLPAADAMLGHAALREDGAVVSDGEILYRFP